MSELQKQNGAPIGMRRCSKSGVTDELSYRRRRPAISPAIASSPAVPGAGTTSIV